MPRRVYKKKSTRPRRKYAPKRKPRSKSSFTLVRNPSIGGFPKNMFTTLKYHTPLTLDVGAAGINAVNVFCLNGLYDPDISGVGAQPRGFDQWMGLYQHFYVKSATITVTFAPMAGGGNSSNAVGIAFRDDTATETQAYDYIEQDCSYRIMGDTGSQPLTLKRYFKFKSSNGVSYKQAENKGGIAANPDERTFAHVFCGNEFATNTNGVQASVTIMYNVLFTELKDLAGS